jgi:hypothetical protein
MQYTLRNIPDYVDAALRRTAQEQRKSLNEVAIEALVHGAGLSENPRPRRNLSDVAASWHEDAAFDSALAAQDTLDEKLWPKQLVGLKRPRKRRVA